MDEVKTLRQLPEIQNIAEYLRNMEFRKKAFGGVDVESVLEHFSAVTLQYEAIISAFMQQADVYARRLAESQALLQDQQAQSAAPQPVPQPQQWYGDAAACPSAQQPYGPQEPWVQESAPQPYNPWAQQPVPQAYDPWAQQAVPQAPAYAWQGGAESLPPVYTYG